MIKLSGRAIFAVLSLAGALGMFASPAMAMNYSPGTYELSVGGSYTGQDDQESTTAGCSTNGPAIGTCPYIPADFSSSNMFAGAGNGTVYSFTFTLSSGVTAYFNISEATGTEQFIVTSYTCGSSGVSGCSSSTLHSGPTTIDDPSGLSFAFSAGGSAVNYLVQLQLNNGDDPTNDISLTSSADYSIDSATTPLPAALPMMAGGLGFIGLLSRRRKRQNAAALAAA
jgi:hypothetical protein